jgi:hypothetical protein
MRNRGQSPPLLPFLLAALLALAVAPARAENIDPDGDGHQYAWGENVGWLNAEPSEDGGNGVQVADFTLTGWMWGENIGWVSLTCDNTGTCGSTQYGVVNDGSGKLSGSDVRRQDRSDDRIFFWTGMGREHRVGQFFFRSTRAMDGSIVLVPGNLGRARSRSGAHAREGGARVRSQLGRASGCLVVRRRRGNSFRAAREPR